jgi:hypothetical protein
MSEEELSAEEISRRIVTGMGLVYDLFKELHSLFRLIAQGLENSDADIQPQGPKGYILPRGKKGITVADRFLKTDMGLLVAIGVPGSDEPDDDDISDEVSDDDEQEAEKDTATVAISADTQYLGIRAILFDPQAKDPAKFQPVLVAGIMGSLTKEPRGGKKKAAGKKSETKFQIRRAAVKMLVKQLPGNAQPGLSLSARVRGAVLNAELGSVHVTPLAEITTEEKVNEFVNRLVSMVEG